LYRRHGFVDSRQCALTLSADTDRAALRDRIWQLRTQTPTHIADLPVTARRDLLQPPPETNLPATDAFVLELDHAHRVTIRPSGTEPKLKIYLDCATTLAASDALPQVRTRLQHLSERIALDLRQRLGL
jgi:phosphomannomutase